MYPRKVEEYACARAFIYEQFLVVLLCILSVSHFPATDFYYFLLLLLLNYFVPAYNEPD